MQLSSGSGHSISHAKTYFDMCGYAELSSAETCNNEVASDSPEASGKSRKVNKNNDIGANA